MELILNEADFFRDKLTVPFGTDREAEFTIVERDLGNDYFECKIDKINILVYTVNADGVRSNVTRQSPIIGTGNRIVGVVSDNPELRGKTLARGNMSECVIFLYEDEA